MYLNTLLANILSSDDLIIIMFFQHDKYESNLGAKDIFIQLTKIVWLFCPPWILKQAATLQ